MGGRIGFCVGDGGEGNFKVTRTTKEKGGSVSCASVFRYMGIENRPDGTHRRDVHRDTDSDGNVLLFIELGDLDR
jgi:hypothetical protein